MTLLKISKLKFFVILFLILLIPVSKKYRLLLFGTRTEGIAVGYGESQGMSTLPTGYDYTFFRFDTQTGSFEIRGPENVIYELGDKARVIYDKRDPNKCIIFSFDYLYSSPNAMLPGVLLLFWIAFYTSFVIPGRSQKSYRKPSS